MHIIKLDGVGIEFAKSGKTPSRLIHSSIFSIFKTNKRTEKFWALKGITFTAQKGDIIGVIGKNGAGKSTLLKVISGVLNQDCGLIEIQGKVCSLLSFGAGFMPNLSGRDNLYLNGMYLGFNRRQMDTVYDKIVSFAELEEFINTPLRYYSNGMKARLGFSIAVHNEPDILVVDEVLAAGDKDFKIKAQKKMQEFMSKAKAIVIASHSTKMINDLCNKCLWLERGRIKAFDSAAEVVKAYLDS